MIVDVEATRAIRQAEVGAARTMLERTETRFGMKPASLTADSAYGSADSLAWLVKEKDIAPHIPVFDRSTEPTTHFPAADFAFDAERDRCTCPAEQRACPIPTHLRHSQKRRHGRGHKILLRQQIGLRHLQAQTTALPERSCPQDPAGSARRRPQALWPVAHARNSAIPGEPVAGERKSRCCSHISSRSLRLARLRLRGLNGAKDEFLLAAARLKPESDSPA